MGRLWPVSKNRMTRTIALAVTVITALLIIFSMMSVGVASVVNEVYSPEFKAWLIAPIATMKIWQAMVILWISLWLK